MSTLIRGGTLTEQIRLLIFQGAYPPKQHLSEYALSEELSASRTRIRNALSSLELEDLVIYKENRGYFVRSMTYLDIQSRLRVRAAMEGLAARIVASHGISESNNQLLRSADAECQKITSTHNIPRGADMDRYLEAVQRFYGTLRKAANNPLLSDTIKRSLYFPVLNNDRVNWVEHEAFVTRQIPALIISSANLDRTRILDAISEGNGIRAETLMREHIFSVSQGIEKLRRQLALTSA